MNPLVQKIIRGLIRLALVPLAGWLVGHRIIESSETAEFYAEVTAYVLSGLWLIYTAVTDLRVKNTQAAMPAGTTEAEAVQQVKSGQFASALTAKTETPTITR